MFKDERILMKSLILCAVMASLVTPAVGAAHDPFQVLLVDKAKHEIAVGAYSGDHIEVKRKFHVTLGKALGDKEVEKDLKTPEGIYFLTAKLTPPSLKKKFGNMAFMVNYPNPIDQIAGKTGYSIMLHATDDPPRLKRDYDSEGCVVIDNPEIEEISRDVRLGLTPIIIYPELKPEYLKVEGKPAVRAAFDKWISAWNGKDIENYIGAYSKKFHFNGMNLKSYRDYKNNLNHKYSEIQVKADHLRFYYHPKYDVVSFTQIYQSKLKNGAKGFKSSGTKYVYFVNEDGQLRIIDESYSTIKED